MKISCYKTYTSKSLQFLYCYWLLCPVYFERVKKKKMIHNIDIITSSKNNNNGDRGHSNGRKQESKKIFNSIRRTVYLTSENHRLALGG